MADRSGPRSIAAATAALCTGLVTTSLFPPSPRLLWNASPSSPVGLYLVRGAGPLRPGDMAVASPPQAIRGLAAERHYLPRGLPLVKRVAAIEGARLCASGRLVAIDGRAAASRRRRDRAGRRLPWWTGCVRLGPGELFLLSQGRPDAFDGRYFGITRPSEVIGKALLLWPR